MKSGGIFIPPPFICVATLPCEMFVLKNPCPRDEWNEMPCKTQSFETVAEKYSTNDVSTILLTDVNIFTVVMPIHSKNQQLYATAATKQKDVTTKRLRTQSTFRRSQTASTGESEVVEKHQFDAC